MDFKRVGATEMFCPEGKRASPIMRGCATGVTAIESRPQMSWSIQQPIAVVAPHLVHPARNGADISLERVARFLSLHSSMVDLIGCNSMRRYRNGEIINEERFANQLRPKWLAGFRTLLIGSHYLQERFNTLAMKSMIHRRLGQEDYGTILASYLVTLSLLPRGPAEQRVLVWTHNDEFKWFEDLARSATNPVDRAVAHASLRWLFREVPRLSKKAVFLHVTENDRDGFDRVVSGHRNLVASIGTDIDLSLNWPPLTPDRPIILSFVGGLGVKMASDALDHFHRHFETALHAAFGERLVIQVVGSQPTEKLLRLCGQRGWSLHADVSEQVLSQLLGESTFSILPFPYATGAKLKLIRSLGSGIPFLSTRASQPQGMALPSGCCFSDDPAEWVLAIRAWLMRRDVDSARQALLDLARKYSWPVVVAQLAQSIERLAVV